MPERSTPECSSGLAGPCDRAALDAAWSPTGPESGDGPAARLMTMGSVRAELSSLLKIGADHILDGAITRSMKASLMTEWGCIRECR